MIGKNLPPVQMAQGPSRASSTNFVGFGHEEEPLDLVAIRQYGEEIGCPYLAQLGSSPETQEMCKAGMSTATHAAVTAGIGLGTVAAGCPKI